MSVTEPKATTQLGQADVFIAKTVNVILENFALLTYLVTNMIARYQQAVKDKIFRLVPEARGNELPLEEKIGNKIIKKTALLRQPCEQYARIFMQEIAKNSLIKIVKRH